MTAQVTILMGKFQYNFSFVFFLITIFVYRIIAVMAPEDSWVCKWQRISRFTRGIYAISVSGRLTTPIIREMKQRGIPYKPRDTSQR